MSIDQFYRELKFANPKAAILSLIPEHSSDFIPVSTTDILPTDLSSL
jgi:hypothetical protein